MEKQLLDRVKKLEQNVVNLYVLQGEGGVSVIGSNFDTIYSIVPLAGVPTKSRVGTGSGATSAMSSIILGKEAGLDSSGSMSRVLFLRE